MKKDYHEQAVSFKSIYRWIYQGQLVKGNTTFLRYKGKHRMSRENRVHFNLGLSIRVRPKEVMQREAFGVYCIIKVPKFAA